MKTTIPLLELLKEEHMKFLGLKEIEENNNFLKYEKYITKHIKRKLIEGGRCYIDYNTCVTLSFFHNKSIKHLISEKTFLNYIKEWEILGYNLKRSQSYDKSFLINIKEKV